MHSKTTCSSLKLLTFLCIVLALQSCGPGKPGIWQGNKITSGKRAGLHAMNVEMLGYLKNNRYQALQFMFSKELLDDPAMMVDVEHISNYMKQDSFTLMREYYVVSPPYTSITIKERQLGINNFDLHYSSLAPEMYVALFRQQHVADQPFLTAVYYKYSYGWKLGELILGQYTIEGKTAPELAARAGKEKSKGYLLDAVNTMALAAQCSKPNDEWQYACDNQMIIQRDSLMALANQSYKFPFEINEIGTHPRIISVFYQKTAGGLFPKIYYVSKIKLKDTLALKQENQKIKKALSSLIPGIDKNKKYVFYAAFNTNPTAKASVDHFDMMDKLQ